MLCYCLSWLESQLKGIARPSKLALREAGLNLAHRLRVHHA